MLCRDTGTDTGTDTEKYGRPGEDLRASSGIDDN
jgi:hypothetical protein